MCCGVNLFCIVDEQKIMIDMNFKIII